MMAPVKAVRKLVEKIGWKLADVDLFELNEAFSVQALAVIDFRLFATSEWVQGGLGIFRWDGAGWSAPCCFPGST